METMQTRDKDSRRDSAPCAIRRGFLEVANGNKGRASYSAGDEASISPKGRSRGKKDSCGKAACGFPSDLPGRPSHAGEASCAACRLKTCRWASEHKWKHLATAEELELAQRMVVEDSWPLVGGVILGLCPSEKMYFCSRTTCFVRAFLNWKARIKPEKRPLCSVCDKVATNVVQTRCQQTYTLGLEPPCGQCVGCRKVCRFWST